MCCLRIVSLGTSGYFLKYDSKTSKLGFGRRRVVTHCAVPFDLTFHNCPLSQRARPCYFNSAWATLEAGSRTLSSFSSD